MSAPDRVPCVMRARVDRHFAGDLPPSEEHALREHLTGCAACTRRYEKQLLLARLDPAALTARDRLGRGLGFSPEAVETSAAPRRRTLRPIAAAAVALVAAAALFVLRPTSVSTPREGDFQARGGGSSAGAPTLVVRRVVGTTLAPAGETLGARDELAFAYENPEARPFVLVFAVDEKRRVSWYHPAWVDPAQDPAAIAARPGAASLDEAVRQPFAPGEHVRICAAFGDTPITVRAVERALADGGEAAPDLTRAWKGSVTRCTMFTVVP